MEDQGGPPIVDKKIVVSSSEQTNDEINDPTVDDRGAANFERPGIKFHGHQDMRISIGGDHAGYELKAVIRQALMDQGELVVDEGTNGPESTDYPDFAHAVANAVARKDADLGIVVCGSANGVNITANKHAGIRSAIAWTEEVARLARAHNDANVLALPARFIDAPLALRIVSAFISTRFEGGRHERRVQKIEGEATGR